MNRTIRKFTENIKKIEGDVAGEVDNVKGSIEVVEGSIKSMAMRHIEVLGVFSAILALLISSASIASNMKTTFGACVVLAMMVGVVVVLVLIVSNVVSGRAAVDKTLILPVVVIISVLCGAFLLDGRSSSLEAKSDRVSAEGLVNATHVQGGAANATSSK